MIFNSKNLSFQDSEISTKGKETMIGIDTNDGKKTSFTLADVRNSDVSFSTQAIYEIYPGRWIGENTVTGRGGYVLYSIEEP